MVDSNIENENKVLDLLKKIEQNHILDLLNDKAKYSNQDKSVFYKQLMLLNSSYPGGLENYVSNARKLLKDSTEDRNPYEDFEVEVPPETSSFHLDFNKIEEIDKLETIGLEELKKNLLCFSCWWAWRKIKVSIYQDWNSIRYNYKDMLFEILY